LLRRPKKNDPVQRVEEVAEGGVRKEKSATRHESKSAGMSRDTSNRMGGAIARTAAGEPDVSGLR